MRIKKFTIENYRSINKQLSISFEEGGNVSAFFGPNGSGKTNLLSALVFFKNFTQNSTKYEWRHMRIPTFALTGAGRLRESKFVLSFDDGCYEYEYGFAILDGVVSDEFLKRRVFRDDKYSTLFRRRSILTGRYKKYGFTAEMLGKTRNDALLLTKAYENNNKEALAVFNCLERIWLLSGAQPMDTTSRMVLENPDFKKKVLKFLKEADLFIQDLSVKQIKVPEAVIKALPFDAEVKEQMNRDAYDISTTHFVYDEAGKIVRTKQMSLVGQESNGTQRMYELAYAVIKALEEGNVLCIDEFDLHLHPKECQYIVSLFNNAGANRKNAQLIVTTHATQIMDYLGRNSIYLVGKNAKEETVVGKPLLRKDDKRIEKKYLNNRFGGIPRVEIVR